MSRCAAALKLPPSKVPTDFIGDRFVNTAIGFMVVQTVLVTLRYYARYLRKTPLGADDFLLPIAALFSYGQQTIGIRKTLPNTIPENPDDCARSTKLTEKNEK